MVGLDCGLGFKHALARFMIAMTSSSSCVVRGGSLGSNMSFKTMFFSGETGRDKI